MSKLDVRALARAIHIGEAPTDMAWLEDYTAAVLDAVASEVSFAVELDFESATACVEILDSMKP